MKEDYRQKQPTFISDMRHYEQDVPFEVPKGWVWTTLGEISSKIGSGSTPRGSNYSEDGIPFFRSQNVYNDGLVYEDIKFISDITHQSMIGTEVHSKDLLLNITGGSLGRCAIVPAEFQIGNVSQHVCIIRPIFVLSSYVHTFILSSLFKKTMNITGSGREGLPKYNLEKMFLPLPPLAEQQRIVIEIGKWFALIDTIEQGKEDLQTAIKQTKNKILDLAIHGKLVPQDTSDEPASVLLRRINPKAQITCDNEHYTQLPKGWVYCTLENICNIHDNKRKAINATERAQRINGKDISKLFPYFGATGQAGYIDKYIIEGKYILLGEDGAPFLDKFAIKAYEVNGKCWVNNHAHILEPLCNFEYIKFVLNFVDYTDYVNGSTRLKLTQTDMRVIKIPLPPMEEQERIVTAIDKLFSILT